MKKEFFGWIVRHRKAMIVIFAILAVVCLGCKQLVGVDYDMNDYLPSESPSTVALGTMDEEFGSNIPNARIMVNDVTIPEALQYKSEIEAVEGVDEVTWLDDAADVEMPLDMQDTDTVETYYKDGSALFSVTIDDGQRIEAVNAIRDIIGDDGAMSGSAVSTAVATQSTVKEINIITIVVLIIMMLVLVLTTTSWAEPLLVLVGLGVAVIINAGTNLMFGTISFVTNAAGTILQVGISLDFAVFLLHRVNECRGTTDSPENDMVAALCKSSTAIGSSALTVTFGFLALTVMQFKIGPDLGFALAKGMLISVITVFTFVPALMLVGNKTVLRTQHRPFVPPFTKFGKAVCAAMIPAVCLFALLPIPSYLASTSDSIDYLYGSSHIFGSETQVGADSDAIQAVFGQDDTYVIMVPRGDVVREGELSDALHDIPEVTSIVSYVDSVGSGMPDGMVDDNTLSKLESDDYSRMIVSVDADYEGADTFALVDQIRDVIDTYYPDGSYLAGEGVSTADLKDTITADKTKVDVLAVLAVLIVLIFATKSLTLPVLLVLVIETAIWFNFSIPYFTGEPEFYIAYLICSSIQLGATVDYAILFTDRYKEARQTMPKKEAVKATVASTTVPILTSGSVLTAAGFTLGIVSTHGVLSQLGIFLGKGVLFSLVVVLFVLPGLLYLCDGLIAKTTYHAGFLKKGEGEGNVEM